MTSLTPMDVRRLVQQTRNLADAYRVIVLAIIGITA